VNQNIQREISNTGVALLIFDRQGSSANIFDQATMDELNNHLDYLESDKSLKGLVICSAKQKVFIAGADLNIFAKGLSAENIIAGIERGQKTFDRIAKLQYPTVAAIHGAALGGGFEICLACDYRIASSDASTKIGLPETSLGILPAWGGSTRLPRLIGLPNALEAIMTGRQYPARQALRLGIVDSVVFPEKLRSVAIAKITRPGSRKRSYKTHLSNRPPLSRLIKSQAEKKALARTRSHYPAPLKALEVACASVAVPHEQSLLNERTGFLELVQTETAKNLIGIFFLQERSKKLKLPKELESMALPPVKPVNRALVVGAGQMGAGIAQWLSSRGIRVLLKDIAAGPLGKGIQSISKLYAGAVKRFVMSETEARNAFDRILPTTEDVPLRNIDLVIEAAVEQLEIKQRLFVDLESKVASEVILASNTSSLSIDTIAASLHHPERVVGFHFFNPVHRMQLVEIVRGPKTNASTLNTAIQFAKQIGKLPVLVNDSPGFLVNRILLPYFAEAIRIFAEGHRVETIDRIMLQFGMPMGPLRLIDEVGLDVAEYVSKSLENRVTHIGPQNDTLEKMIAKGWLGRKAARGFYVYGGTSDEKTNPQIGELQPGAPANVNEDDLRDRLVLSMVNEAARTLEEKVVSAPEDVDFAMIMGTGWAPFRGGPLRYADHLGIASVVSRLNSLRERLASHYEPCALLSAMVNRGATFYPERGTVTSTGSEPTPSQ
jgi:3-hydroxyacyl-CoA dehydrogenase / enoyl-CoA hydratase / 3-hydroxybutyryl-CoA epimerase